MEGQQPILLWFSNWFIAWSPTTASITVNTTLLDFYEFKDLKVIIDVRVMYSMVLGVRTVSGKKFLSEIDKSLAVLTTTVRSQFYHSDFYIANLFWKTHSSNKKLLSEAWSVNNKAE